MLRPSSVLSFLVLGLTGWPGPVPGPEGDHESVRGITISCQTWGWEWGSDGFGPELDELAALGVNWIAIHPYAGIRGDGRLRPSGGEFQPATPPEWLSRPIAEAEARRMAFLVKPHLAYWGSPFAWRGEIRFDEPAARARFWTEYSDWIVGLARVTGEADAFCVGTELDRMLGDEDEWRALIARVREVTGARLTYAANWDAFENVPFWDALDAIGIQAYFPLSEEREPGEADLRAGWDGVLARLRRMHERTGKPVVFTELGYHASPHVASQPWSDSRAEDRDRAGQLQQRCLRLALEILDRERSWLRGAFLWKWFVGEPHHRESFLLDTPEIRALIAEAWG